MKDVNIQNITTYYISVLSTSGTLHQLHEFCIRQTTLYKFFLTPLEWL